MYNCHVVHRSVCLRSVSDLGWKRTLEPKNSFGNPGAALTGKRTEANGRRDNGMKTRDANMVEDCSDWANAHLVTNQGTTLAFKDTHTPTRGEHDY